MSKYTKALIVSGAPLNPLHDVQEHFKFAELHATAGCIEEGVYTGRYNIELATSGAKNAFMKTLVSRIHVDPEKSFAFGDSESDIPLLEAVNPRNSFVFGEKEEIVHYAKHKGLILACLSPCLSFYR
jgi:phosphoserine phosphatase